MKRKYCPQFVRIRLQVFASLSHHSLPLSPSPCHNLRLLVYLRGKSPKNSGSGWAQGEIFQQTNASHKQIIKVQKVRPSSRPWQRPLQRLIYQCAARSGRSSRRLFLPLLTRPQKRTPRNLPGTYGNGQICEAGKQIKVVPKNTLRQQIDSINRKTKTRQESQNETEGERERSLTTDRDIFTRFT